MRPGDEFVGRYVLKEVIGAGRGGDVWLAHDTVVGQDVALKPERIEGDRETALRRLLGEPRAMAKFRDHPHVVTLFDVVTVPPDGAGAGETYWFVMEYVPGRGLGGQRPMSPERVADIGAQLADALAALHEAGIVHCDVKPANAGLTRRGTAKLLDFGAAYRIGGAETVTVNGPFSFTPDYAAPELARGHVPRPASDVFGLGATLYALVTGSPPRGGEPDGEDGDGDGDEERLTYWKAEQGFVEMDADAVGPLHPLLTAMLHRDPRQRPDAAEAGRLLAAVAGPEPELAEVTSGERSRRRWLPATAGGVAAAALVLSLVISGDDGDATQDAGATSGESGSLIGDPRTADLCALADTDALGLFGAAELDPEYRNFDSCDVLVSPDEDTRIDVQIQFRPGLPPETAKPARTVGGIGLLREPAEDDDEVCGVVLLPARGADDGTLVRIRVQVEDGTVAGGIATLCTMADAAAQPAAEVLDRGPIPRRSPPYPDESLAWANACELLDAESLSTVPGILANAPEVGVANWDCKWFSKIDELVTEVRFFRDEVTKEYGEPISLGRYNAYVVPERNGPGTCAVFVPYRPYGDRNAATAYEILRLYVGGKRPVPELCAMATGLVASAAAELPAL